MFHLGQSPSGEYFSSLTGSSSKSKLYKKSQTVSEDVLIRPDLEVLPQMIPRKYLDPLEYSLYTIS